MSKLQITILSILALIASCVMATLVCSLALILESGVNSNSALSGVASDPLEPSRVHHPSKVQSVRTPAPTSALPLPRNLLSPTPTNTRVVADTPTVTPTLWPTPFPKPSEISATSEELVYEYTVIGDTDDATSFIFTSNSKPELTIDETGSVNIETINAALTRLNLPRLTYAVPELSSITGLAGDTGVYYWEDYLFGSLTIWRASCQEGSDKSYDCISRVTVSNQKSFIPTPTPTFALPPIILPSTDDDDYDYSYEYDDDDDSGSSGGCCKYCSKGKPCGDSCISGSKTCHQPPGCAC